MRVGRGGGALQQHRLSIFEEKAVCNSQFEQLYQSGQIDFMILGSSQGRHALRDPNHDSTDGCSIIAGLNVVNHISTLDIDDVITNETIDDIMDNCAPPILREIRETSRLSGNIDWDTVFDYFQGKHLLHPNNQYYCMGGNILDKDFINNEVITTLLNRNELFPLSKSGAILTFKKHIVSILQIPRRDGGCWYDLIESLPKEGFGSCGYRARAHGVESLAIMIQWYAFSRYSDDDLNYIHSNQYDLEPRMENGEWIVDRRQISLFFYCHPSQNASSAETFGQFEGYPVQQENTQILGEPQDAPHGTIIHSTSAQEAIEMDPPMDEIHTDTQFGGIAPPTHNTSGFNMCIPTGGNSGSVNTTVHSLTPQASNRFDIVMETNAAPFDFDSSSDVDSTSTIDHNFSSYENNTSHAVEPTEPTVVSALRQNHWLNKKVANDCDESEWLKNYNAPWNKPVFGSVHMLLGRIVFLSIGRSISVFQSQSWQDAMRLIIIMKATWHKKVKMVSLMMIQVTELLLGILWIQILNAILSKWKMHLSKKPLKWTHPWMRPILTPQAHQLQWKPTVTMIHSSIGRPSWCKKILPVLLYSSELCVSMLS